MLSERGRKHVSLLSLNKEAWKESKRYTIIAPGLKSKKMATFFQRLSKSGGAAAAFCHVQSRAPIGAIAAICGGLSYFYYFDSPHLVPPLPLFSLLFLLFFFKNISLYCYSYFNSAL